MEREEDWADTNKEREKKSRKAEHLIAERNSPNKQIGFYFNKAN